MNDTIKDKEKECVEIAKRYIKNTKRLSPDRFIFKYHGRKSDTGVYVVDAVFDEDLKLMIPGGTGNSVQVHIDLEKRKVKKTLRWQ